MSFNKCCLSPNKTEYNILHEPIPIYLPSNILEVVEMLLWYSPGINSRQSRPNSDIDDTIWARARFNAVLSNMDINVENDIAIGYPTEEQIEFFKDEICLNCQKIIFTHSTNESELKAFLRHIRNALAHGHFQIVNDYIILFDYNRSEINTAIIKVDINKLYDSLKGLIL